MDREQGFHPVVNLRALNRFLPKEKFKMERLHTALSLHDENSPEGCLLCSIDSSGLREIPLLSFPGNNIQIPLPLVWSVAGSPQFLVGFCALLKSNCAQRECEQSFT